MEIEDWPNLVVMFLANAEARREQPFLWEKRNGAYQSTSWGEAENQVLALASALQARGLGPGDRVLLLANNSPRWVIADFAIMAAGCVTVPVYTTNTISNHNHILGDIDANAAIVSTATLARPFLEAARQFETLKHVIAMEDWGDLDHGNAVVTSWDDTVVEGKTGAGAVAAAAPAIDRDATAAVIYTSGTGGNPRGVMLSHRSIIANCVGAAEVLDEVGLDDEVFLSFLPLSHAYEHSAGLMFPVSIGAQIYFAERVDTLTSNLLEARPTIMTSVPRLYEVMREKILRDVSRQGGLRENLVSAAVRLGRKRYESAGSMTWTERIADRVVDRLVRDAFRARFGGRLKALVSGGAPLNYDVGLFLTALGLRLLQGYGQTEAGPVITCNRCGRIKLRTVGPPLKHVELRIADDGEVLVRGPLLMDGYWRQPEASAEALRDGWLHTGDIGVVDDDGYLRITDRKKDIIVNSAGETISPQKIELELTLEPEIDAAMAVGDNRPHIVAIIVPAADFVTRWAATRGTPAGLADFSEDRDFIGAMGQAVDRANRNLAPAERVKRFVVADQPFTIENGMMTPTMKPRRHMILNRWGPAIDEAGR